MFTSAGVIFIVFLIVVAAVVLSLAISYELQFYACKNHRNPWCFDDWMCHAPTDPTALSDLNAKIQQQGGSEVLTAGRPYNIVDYLFRPTITKCTTANVDPSDSSTVSYFMVNRSDGSTMSCNPSIDGPTCRAVPNGCLYQSGDTYTPLNFNNVWLGQVQGASP